MEADCSCPLTKSLLFAVSPIKKMATVTTSPSTRNYSLKKNLLSQIYKFLTSSNRTLAAPIEKWITDINNLQTCAIIYITVLYVSLSLVIFLNNNNKLHVYLLTVKCRSFASLQHVDRASFFFLFFFGFLCCFGDFLLSVLFSVSERNFKWALSLSLLKRLIVALVASSTYTY